jgi:hypothetical protein
MTSTIAFKEYLTPKERRAFNDCYYRGLPPGNPNVAVPSATGWRVCVDDIEPVAQQRGADPTPEVAPLNGFSLRVCAHPISPSKTPTPTHKSEPVEHISTVVIDFAIGL